MEWFLLNAGRVEGPFKSQELKDKMERNEIDAATFVCRQGDPHWKPLEELREEILTSAKPDEELKNWILLTENLELALSKEQEGQFVQSGPYTTLEIVDLLQAGQAKYSDFIWKSGFEKWVRINEVDEFFGAPKAVDVAPVIEAPALSEATIEESDSQLLEGVLEQTHLNKYDFVEEERAPIEASPIDHAVFKNITRPEIEEEKAVSPSAPQFALSTTTIPEVVESSRVDEIPTRKNVDVIANLFESAQKYFPWLMTGLAAILVLMVGMWALSINKQDSQENAQLPAVPAKKIEVTKPARIEAVAKPPVIPTAPAVKIERAAPVAPPVPEKPVVKAAPVQKPVVDRVALAKAKALARASARAAMAKAAIEKITAEERSEPKQELGNLAGTLLQRAERLESEYENLKSDPVQWKRFYQSWSNEFQKSDQTASEKVLEKSMLYRQLKIGRNRLGDRAQMMDKSVMQSAPVSSDFDAEDLPGLFRNIQGQLQKR